MYGYRKRTLLHKAAQIGDRRLCDLLIIDHGADVNKQDARKQTPLWVAAEEGHKDICEVLIQNGAAVDENDVAQRTPLWIAARKKHMDVFKILVDNGADIYEGDELGTYPMQLFDKSFLRERLGCWWDEYSKIFYLSHYFPIN